MTAVRTLAVVGSSASLAARAGTAGLDVLALQPTADHDPAAYARLAALPDPRILALDLDPGAELDRILETAYLALEPGDVVIDASGSWWCDTLRRGRRMRHRALHYLDMAEPDPPAGPLLLAGDEEGRALACPFLERLTPQLVHAGAAGAAHFASMLAEARGAVLNRLDDELRQLLEAAPLGLAPAVALCLDLASSPRPWRRAAWLPDDALRLEAAVPLLAQALMLEQAAALDAHVSLPPPPRLGSHIEPDELS